MPRSTTPPSRGTLVWASLLLSLSLWLSASAQAQPVADTLALDSLSGVGGLRVGMSLESAEARLGPLARAGRFQRTLRYRPLRRDLVIEGIAIDRLVLFAYHGRLHSFELTARGEAAATELLGLLERRFGVGEADSRSALRRWQSGRVILTYDPNLLTRDATARFESVELQRAIERSILRELNEPPE